MISLRVSFDLSIHTYMELVQSINKQRSRTCFCVVVSVVFLDLATAGLVPFAMGKVLGVLVAGVLGVAGVFFTILRFFIVKRTD